MMNTTADSVDPPLRDRIAQLWADSFAWLFGHSTQIILAAMLGAAIVAMLLAAKWFGKRLCRVGSDPHDWRTVIGRALARTRLWFMIAVAAQIVAAYAHAPADLAKTINFLFVIASTLQAATFARELILGAVEYRATGHESLGSALTIIRLLVTVTLFAIAIVLILSNLGVNVTGLVAGLGVGGIAIGLAAQGIFRDLFAALAILFDRPFRVGELIKFGDAMGRVQAIGLKTTRVRSLDGEQIIISNDKLLDLQIRNYHGIDERRIVLSLPLHYGNDPAKLAALPTTLADALGTIPNCRFGQAVLTAFEANAVMLEIVLHSTRGDADTRDRARHLVIAAALACLRHEGIAMSYQATDAPSDPHIVEA